MKLVTWRYAGILATFIGCGSANSHGIVIDNWQQVGGVVSSTVASVDESTLLDGPLSGVSSLSFAPGTTTPGYAIATLGNESEYAWGDGTGGAGVNVTVPSEQILITPGATAGGKTAFTVAFNYADGSFGGPASGGPGETASLVIDGVTFTTTDPSVLTDSSTFIFTGDTLSNASTICSAWKSSACSGGGGTVSAPEIDPASTASALTLLLGGLLYLASRRKSSATGYSSPGF